MQSRTGRHLDASDFGAAWCDGRSAAAHRYTALSQQHQSDIGGVHFLAFPVVQVVLEVAVANAELEILEEKVVLLFEREAWRYGRPRAHCARAHCARAHCAFRTAPARTAPPRTAPPRTAPPRTAPARTPRTMTFSALKTSILQSRASTSASRMSSVIDTDVATCRRRQPERVWRVSAARERTRTL